MLAHLFRVGTVRVVQHIQTKLDERNPIKGNGVKGSPWKKGM